MLDTLSDFWELYKHDSITFKFHKGLKEGLVQIAVPIFAHFLLPESMIGVASAVLLAFINILLPLQYYWRMYKPPMVIFDISTWNKSRRSVKPHAKPTVKHTWTIFRAYIRFRKQPDYWQIRIWTPSEIQVRKSKMHWADEWEIKDVDNENFTFSCSQARNFPDFSLHLEMKQLPPFAVQTAQIKVFYKTSPSDSEKLAKRIRIWQAN